MRATLSFRQYRLTVAAGSSSYFETSLVRCSQNAALELHLGETSVLAPRARRAIVATDRAISGFRMYGALFERQVDGSAVGVFTTLDDAIEWVTP